MRSLLVKVGLSVGALLLIAMQSQAATFYFHNDHLGTPQVVTGENQAVVWKGEYDPFGRVTETVSAVEQNLRFPGQYFDGETGLHYNYFRIYDPNIGRYVESDPIGLHGGLSTYAYSLVNPIKYFDSTGLSWECRCTQSGKSGGDNVPGGKRCQYSCKCSCSNSIIHNLFPFIKDEVTVVTVTTRYSKEDWDRGSLVCHGQKGGSDPWIAVEFNSFFVGYNNDWSRTEYPDVYDAISSQNMCDLCEN